MGSGNPIGMPDHHDAPVDCLPGLPFVGPNCDNPLSSMPSRSDPPSFIRKQGNFLRRLPRLPESEDHQSETEPTFSTRTPGFIATSSNSDPPTLVSGRERPIDRPYGPRGAPPELGEYDTPSGVPGHLELHSF
jgi:hypothetical protein